MTIDYNALEKQCKKGFGKEIGKKIRDKSQWIDNRSFAAMDGFYVYALFDVGRKTRLKNGLKELKDSYKALNEIIKAAEELKQISSAEQKKIRALQRVKVKK